MLISIIIYQLLYQSVLTFQFSPKIFLFRTRNPLLVPVNQNSVKHRNEARLYMVFDFIKKRTVEGIAQVQNIASKTLEGKLGEALLESAEYIKKRQEIDKENLRRLTEGWDSIF